MSDYLTDEEQLDRIKTWWEEYGRILVATLVIGIGSVIGWRWYDETKTAETAAASDLYADYLNADESQREQFAESIGTEIPESAYNVLVQISTAAEAVQAEDYELAETQLRSAAAAARVDVLRDLVNVRLARVLMQADKTDAALATLGQIRGEGFRPVVAELKGDIHLSRGERALAHESYRSAFDAVADLPRNTQRALLELKVTDTADAADA